MDVITYTQKRLIIMDKSPLNVMLGWTFTGASLILFIFLFVFQLDKPEYLPFGIFLLCAGVLLLYFARETTVATFDNEQNLFEIVRKPIFGKILIEKYELDRISEVKAEEKSPKGDRLRFRISLLLDQEKWVPLTRAWQSDGVAFDTYPTKIETFLQQNK